MMGLCSGIPSTHHLSQSANLNTTTFSGTRALCARLQFVNMDCGCAIPDEAFRGIEEDNDMLSAEELRHRNEGNGEDEGGE
jgi:hypothetical protein